MDANEIVTAITERVRDAANVNVVFGDVMESGGVSVIPVASVKISGGGGGGTGQQGRGGDEEAETAPNNGKGMGLGLMVAARPLGYIELKEGNARFVPIADVTRIAIGGMMTAGLFLLTMNRLMRLKAWRKRQMMWHKMRKAHPAQ